MIAFLCSMLLLFIPSKIVRTYIECVFKNSSFTMKTTMLFSIGTNFFHVFVSVFLNGLNGSFKFMYISFHKLLTKLQLFFTEILLKRKEKSQKTLNRMFSFDSTVDLLRRNAPTFIWPLFNIHFVVVVYCNHFRGLLEISKYFFSISIFSSSEESCYWVKEISLWFRTKDSIVKGRLRTANCKHSFKHGS